MNETKKSKQLELGYAMLPTLKYMLLRYKLNLCMKYGMNWYIPELGNTISEMALLHAM